LAVDDENAALIGAVALVRSAGGRLRDRAAWSFDG
jgi:hypothetical protein